MRKKSIAYSGFFCGLYPEKSHEISAGLEEAVITSVCALPDMNQDELAEDCLKQRGHPYIRIDFQTEIEEFEFRLCEKISVLMPEQIIKDPFVLLEKNNICLFIRAINFQNLAFFCRFIETKLKSESNIRILLSCSGCSLSAESLSIPIREIRLEGLDSKYKIRSYLGYCFKSMGCAVNVPENLPWDIFCFHPGFVSYYARLLALGELLPGDLYNITLDFYKALFEQWFKPLWDEMETQEQKILQLSTAIDEPFPIMALSRYPEVRKTLLNRNILLRKSMEDVQVHPAVLQIMRTMYFYRSPELFYNMGKLLEESAMENQNCISVYIHACNCYKKAGSNESLSRSLKKLAAQVLEYGEKVHTVISMIQQEISASSGVVCQELIAFLVRIALLGEDIATVDKYLPVMAEGIEKVLCLAEINYLTRNLTEAMNLYESIENEYENSFFLNIRKAKILNFMGRPGDGLKLLEVIGVRNEKAVNSLTSGEWYLTRAMIGEGVKRRVVSDQSHDRRRCFKP